MRTKFSAAIALLALSVSAVSLAQAPGGPPRGGGGGGGIVPMLIESGAYPDGGVIPLKYSMYGGSTLPGFKITKGPANAQTIAIIFHDLDVASGGNTDDNLHWMAWNIPMAGGNATIEEGKLPDGATGKGMMGPAFAGPGAPNLGRYHHYIFEFYALSEKLDLPATAGRPELLAAMKGKVVAKAAYAGRFTNDTNAQMQMGGARPGGGAGGPPRGPGAGGPPGAGPGAPPAAR